MGVPPESAMLTVKPIRNCRFHMDPVKYEGP
jgi:hypothetical protein